MGTPAYTQSQIQQELFHVFRSVWYENLRQKIIVETSYFDNLYLLVAYANENNLDVKEYIRSIRDILLQTPGVYAYKQHNSR